MTASVFVGTSLDGFIARKDGRFDFLPSDGGGAAGGFDAFLAGIDAIVMGRNTFESVLPFPEWPYGTTRVVVLTHRPVDLSKVRGNVETMEGTPHEIVERLAARGIRNLYVDGGETIHGFLRAGLIDRIIVTTVPVLIGDGIPLFGSLPHDVGLKHIGTKALPGGMVQSEYHVAR